MAQSTGIRNCPACNAVVIPGRARCISCGLPVEKMPELAAAKAHAAKRGIRRTLREDEEAAPAFPWLKLAVLGAVAVVLIVGLVVGISLLRGSREEAWKRYPTNARAEVTELFGLIAKGDDASLSQAYKLMSLNTQNPDDADDAKKWGWVYKDINEYLTGEFGPGWSAGMNVIPEDPAKGDEDTLYLVKVRTETFHVQVEPQGPKGKPAPTPAHYGVALIREFPFDDSQTATNKAQGVSGYLSHVYGAKGSAEQISSISAVFGGRANESTMAIKRRLLPVVRDPNATGLKQALYHMWRVRTDETVRARLESITKDARYSPEMQQLAQKILDGNVSDEELIAAGVPG